MCLVQEDFVASFPNHSGHCQLQRLPGPLPLTNQFRSDLTWLVSEKLILKGQDVPAALMDSNRSCNDGVRSGMRRSPSLAPHYRGSKLDELPCKAGR